MPAHQETQISPYTAEQLYALVSDIERYPEFLPWCRAARILSRSENEFLGELVVCFKHFCESYTSRVTVHPPRGGEAGTIHVEQTKGPFEHLMNHWVFTPLPEGGTRIDFAVDFKFRSKMLDKLIGMLFSQATQKMAGAFTKRADALYGVKQPV